MASLTITLYVLIFLAVLLCVGGISLVFLGPTQSRDHKVNRRLDGIGRDGKREETLEHLRKNTKKKPGGIPIYALLLNKSRKANLALSPQQLIAIMVGLTFATLTGLSLFTQLGWILRGLISVLIGGGGVWFWVSRRASKRLKLAEEQLPDAVELIVRALRVGHPFVSAIQSVARELPDPLGTEFGIVADEAAYGRNISESLRDLSDRTDMQDLRFLAVAVSIQQTSGGNLAEVLEGLSKVIRARFRLMRRVSAITAEPRWSGIFLSAFPLAVLGIILVLAPDFYDDVKKAPSFLPTAVVVFALLGANVVFMKIMTTIRV